MIKKIFLGFQILVISLWSLGANAAEQVGIVIVVKGTLVAIQADKTTRTLKRRSPFYLGEVLRTGDNTTVKLKFIDNALMSLRANTEFRVDAYQYDVKNKAKNKSVMTLIGGGLRTVTGLIGKNNPDGYKLETGVVTIGIRGTDYEAVKTPTGGAVVAFWSGRGFASNKAGRINLGAQAKFKFAEIPTANSRPVGKIKLPSIMKGSVNPKPSKDDDFDPDVLPPTAAGDEGPNMIPSAQPTTPSGGGGGVASES